MNSSKKPLLIAAIGDSITAGFHIASDLNMFLRMWFGRKQSWFSEITRRLEDKIPVISHNFSTAGSELTYNFFSPFLGRLYNITSMIGQVDEVLRLPLFPEIVLIWTGHNELNWTIRKEKDFSKITAQFRQEFQKQLERLCGRALEQNRKAAIIVFEFISIRVLFHIRELAAKAREENPKLFPYFEKGYQMFESIKPEFKEQTIRLADMMNAEVEEAVRFCAQKYQSGKLQIVYSDSLSKMSTDSLEDITDVDGWHPSAKGQRQLAEAAWPVVQKQLDFLLYS